MPKIVSDFSRLLGSSSGRVLFAALVIGCPMASLGCSSEPSPATQRVPIGAVSVALMSELPTCAEVNRGVVYYIESEQRLVYCDGNEHQPLEVSGDSLIVRTRVASAAQCPADGVVILSGTDADGNGRLEASEVLLEVPICNGRDGTSCTITDVHGSSYTLGCEDGTEITVSDGEKGEQGDACQVVKDPDADVVIITCGNSPPVTINSGYGDSSGCDSDCEPGTSVGRKLTVEEPAAPDDTCFNGGRITSSGYDSNQNGQLDPEEIESTAHVCNTVECERGHAHGENINAACEPCVIGQFCQGGDAPAEACDPGYQDHDSDPGTRCVVCAENQYCAGGAEPPAACASGTKDHDSDAATPCEECDAGDFCPGGADPSNGCAVGTQDHDADPLTECEDCTQAGHFCAGGASLSTPCQRGTRDHDSNPKTACIDCEEGYYCPAGSVAPSYCSSGTYDDDSDPATACVTCAEVGQFCAGGVSEPASCEEAEAFDHDRDPKTACVKWDDCDENEYVTETPTSLTNRLCEPCPEGQVSTTLNPSSCSSTTFVSVSLGEFHSCAVRATERDVQCWGLNNYGQSSAPEQGTFSEVSAGDNHTCALHEDDGRLSCWGQNSNGQATPPTQRPANCGPDASCAAPSAVLFSKVSAGGRHTCGIRADDSRIQCWGSDVDGQSVLPAPLVDVQFTSVAAGFRHTCGIRADTGAIACWGFNGSQQATPPTGGGYQSVTSGTFHSCALTSGGQIDCWGLDSHGQASAPEGVFLSVSVGREHTCGLEENGAVSCWGADQFQQSSAPAQAFSAIGAGRQHSCAVRQDDNEVVCWGDNVAGQSSPPSSRN